MAADVTLFEPPSCLQGGALARFVTPYTAGPFSGFRLPARNLLLITYFIKSKDRP